MGGKFAFRAQDFDTEQSAVGIEIDMNLPTDFTGIATIGRGNFATPYFR
jgi:hypothetical protein